MKNSFLWAEAIVQILLLIAYIVPAQTRKYSVIIRSLTVLQK
jgi:hypothetical protein